MGLSFSVAPEVRPVPGSLINIYREYGQDLGYPPPGNGDLTPWTGQGVLLLNRALTTAPGKPAAHRDKTSGGGHSRPFSRANELLAQQGAQPVDWRLQ